ncbi:hypothetical protein ACH41H_43805 [Streptomyces sp. NPDC020800]|uniref:hypothetical protein n=1 Tax=Streptomyces sp. NPDC020800 TaxID=3365092 RepID=UPI0037B488DE
MPSLVGSGPNSGGGQLRVGEEKQEEKRAAFLLDGHHAGDFAPLPVHHRALAAGRARGADEPGCWGGHSVSFSQ